MLQSVQTMPIDGMRTAMDTPLAHLMVTLKNRVPALHWLWYQIWRYELARENRAWQQIHPRQADALALAIAQHAAISSAQLADLPQDS